MTFFFSPYGVLPGEYKEKGQSFDVVMQDWMPDEPFEVRLKAFNKWQQERLAEFNHSLWPRFDQTSRQWVGDAKNFAKDLTELEINIMIEEFFEPERVLDKNPNSPLAREDIGTHLHHYREEDQKKPGVNYQQYDRTLSEKEEVELLDTMIKAITTGAGIGTKAAGHFWFKSQMQRPRPLHTALLFGQEEKFISELSERGQHPAIVSGHCFQSVMMCCAVLEDWNKKNPKPAPERVQSLAQYMIDVGDRRVFAGVHYPSDNIASWLLALSLIPKVFEDHQQITRFCIQAIQERSAVFNSIQKHYPLKDCTKPVLDLLVKSGFAMPAYV